MGSEPSFVKISKIDAARPQLRTAVRLFIQGGDPVSLHTLTAAAHELLRNLLRAQGLEASAIKDNPLVRPGKRQDFLRMINEAENFFKHADKDPDAILEFNPQLTHPFLFDAVIMYERATGRKLKEGVIFATWYMVQYPDVVRDGELRALLDKTRLELGQFAADPALLAPLLELPAPDLD